MMSLWLLALFSLTVILNSQTVSACNKDFHCSSTSYCEDQDNVNIVINGDNNIVYYNNDSPEQTSLQYSGSPPVCDTSYDIFPIDVKFVLPLPSLYFLKPLLKKLKSNNQDNNNENNNHKEK